MSSPWSDKDDAGGSERVQSGTNVRFHLPLLASIQRLG
jgi:hypothetical protein